MTTDGQAGDDGQTGAADGGGGPRGTREPLGAAEAGGRAEAARATNVRGGPTTAVVLAAGEGERLRPLTARRPKPMLPAATRPILEHVLDALIDAGVGELHLVVGYAGDRVRSGIGPDYRGVPVAYHEQTTRLGSGHALQRARGAIDGAFLVVNGDQVIDAAMVGAVRAAHADGDATATLAVVEADRAADYGAVRLSDGRVTELVEQPREGTYRLLNAGVYAFEPDVFGVLDGTNRRGGELALPDGVSRLVDDESVLGVRTDGFWRDAAYPWDLLTLSRELLARGDVDLPEVRRGAYVADSASIHPDATLIPPVAVGPDVAVEAGAVVGPDVAVGAGATVGTGAVVRESTVDEGARLFANATAVGLVAGEDVRVGPGAALPGGPATVRVGSRLHKDVDVGAILADRARIGGGATVVPGTAVGPDARVAAGATLAENVSAGTEVRR